MNFNLAGLIAMIGALFCMPALAQTISPEPPADDTGGAMTAVPSADGPRLPAEPMISLPSAPAPDSGTSGSQSMPQTPQPAQTDPIGDALRIVTPFGPAAQIPTDPGSGPASAGLPVPGGSGLVPAQGADGR